MDEIRYLSLADVLALHQAMMEKFGPGPAPLRAEGSLESAIMRARMAAYYDEADIIRQATENDLNLPYCHCAYCYCVLFLR